MNRIYAGIGSRKTPKHILEQMEEVASILGASGFTLRSGGASGADEAFETGCDSVGGAKEIYIPWETYTRRADRSSIICKKDYSPYYQVTSDYHPAWDRCTDSVKRLHSRNLFIIAGDILEDDPLCDFVVCWTPNGAYVGGTALAMRIADDAIIRVFNLANEGALDELATFLEENYDDL